MSEITIDQLLKQHALNQPDRIAYRFLQDGENKEITLTYSELDHTASRIAHHLVKKKTNTASLALLLYPNSLDFIAAFFSCCYANIIAVPMSVPKNAKTSKKFENILKDTSLTFILTNRATFQGLQRLPLFSSLNKVTWVLTDTDSLQKPLKNHFPHQKKQPIAFLQYTSGSTRAPKGVIVTHNNIISNAQMIQEAFGHDKKTVFVGWLPLFHDMGLIGNVLQPMYLGIPCTLLSPVAFLQKPLIWLAAISKYRATTSGAPDFAYRLCAEKIKPHECVGIDLSSWAVAFNGSEPIHHKTLKMFSHMFNQCGFKEKAFYPCYGMAEATLFVSGPCHKNLFTSMTIDKKILETECRAFWKEGSTYILVGVGKSWKEGKVKIIDPHTQRICPPYEIGEICLRGPHITIGYWKETSQQGDFLRTGDLGFINEDGELFITGRFKDMMIIRGRNIYPQDVEILVEECDDALRPHGCAVFSILQDDEEKLIIVAEIRREKMRGLDPKNLNAKILQCMSQELQITASTIVFIKPGSLPKTSSGKIQRTRCKQLFLNDQLKSLIPSTHTSTLQTKIKKLLSHPIEEIDQNAPLSTYGLDSLGAISLQVFLKEEWDISIGLEEILDKTTLNSLLMRISCKPKPSPISEKVPTKSFSNEHPLSYQQLGIWKEMQTSEAAFGYNLAKGLEILSDLNVEKLRYALSLLMDRHELLRARFSHKKPVLTITATSSLPFEEKTLKEKELTTFFEEKSLKTFALDKDPPFRVFVITTETKRTMLLIVAHHLIADLWSLGIFLEELFQIYEHLFSPSKPLSLPTFYSYTDYIAWQQTGLKKENTVSALSYWEKRLHLPQKTVIKSFRGDHFPFALSLKLSDALKKYAKATHTTPFKVLLTAYFLLILQNEGESQVCIGTTAHGRSDPKWYSTFGMFANPVPLTLLISPYDSFDTLVNRVKTSVLEGLETFQIPYGYLLKNLKRKRNESSFFHAMFVFQHAHTLSKNFQDLAVPTSDPAPLKRGPLQLLPLAWQPPISPMQMTLYMNEKEGRFFGNFEYDTFVFNKKCIFKLHSQFLKILTACIDKPKSKLGFLETSPKTTVKPPKIPRKTLIQLFLSTVEAKSDASALVHGHEQMTYQGLEACSNQFARLLLCKGAKPDAIIAIMLPHSKETLIAIVAILKIGAAFLPIHPLTPKSQREHMLNDSGCSLVISPSTFKGMGKKSFETFPEMGAYDSLAYVMYTSGSTGTPKGVAISHYSLLNYLYAIQQRYDMGEDLHFPLYSSLAFDLTMTSLFFPLLFGHTIHIYPEKSDISQTLSEIFAHPLMTHIKLTPSHLKLLDSISVSSPHLSQMIVGGEQMPLSIAEKTRARFSKNFSMINEYGPTEATIGCISYLYSNSSTTENFSILPIGYPLKGIRAYLFNDYLQEVAENTSAHLYLGGLALAYGYWKKPALTAEKFLPDPFCEGQRIYQTGDLAKKTEGKTLLCLGRNDRQIKLRGFRVELDEIEATIQKHPNVHQCLVFLTKEHVLSAYIACVNISLFKESEMHTFLNAHLSHYMIPSLLIPCTNLPLTISGKIDTNALLSLKPPPSFKKPITPLQQKLATLWADVLKIERENVDISRSFFEVGGDSIKGIQLVAQAKTKGIVFSVSDLFRYSSIEQLCPHVNDQPTESKKEQKIKNHKIPLSPMQRWLFTHFSSHINHYNQSVILHSADGFDPNHVRTAWNAIVSHHDMLREHFPNAISGVITARSEKTWTLDMFDFREENIWKQRMHEKMFFLQKSLNIASGPLMRLGLFSTPEGSSLCIIIHHLIIDGVSWRIILADFDLLMEQIRKGEAPCLPDKTSAYPTWTKSLPENTQPEEVKTFNISDQKIHQFTLSSNLTNNLLLNIHHSYHTQIQDILLAAFYLSLHKILEIRNLSLHLEHHGRQSTLDLSRTVGWFTSLIPITLSVPDPKNFPTLIKSVKEYSKLQQRHLSHPTININYLGQMSSSEYRSFTYTPLVTGTIDPRGKIPYALQLMSWIFDKKLYCYLIFDSLLYPKQVREQIEEEFHHALHTLTIHCLNTKKSTYTPSDFDLKYDSWEQWEHLQTQVTHHQPDGMHAIDKIYPVSPLQEGLIYHMHINPGNAHYIEQAIFDIEGKINSEYVKASLHQLMLSYESLRTAFFYKGLEKPLQIVFKNRSLTVNEEKKPLSSYLKQDRKRGFDLFCEPLIRLALFQKEKDQTVMVWSFHHIILDGWSLSLLVNAFFDNLEKIYQKKTLPPPSTLTLQPYIKWQQSQDMAKASAYWKKLLANAEPTTLPKNAHANNQTRHLCKKVFPQEKIFHLQEIGKRFHLTINTLLQTVWTLLLEAYSHREDIVFGTVIAGRHPEVPAIEQMVGLFIKTIPIRVRTSDYKTFLDLAHAIQQQRIESEKHSALPLSEIQSLSGLKKHLIGHLFVFENYPFAGQIHHILEKKQLPFKVTSASLEEDTHYPFVLSFLHDTAMTMEIQYDTQTYSPTWVESLCAVFEHFLEQVAKNPQIALKEFFLTSKSEHEHLLKLNETEAPFPQDKTLIDLFEEQVSKTPDSIALVFENCQLTYGELNTQAERLALYLSSLGIKPERCVAICLEKSVELITSWLAVLKAGGFYVPLDPKYSSKRIAMICEESFPDLLLTSSASLPHLPPLSMKIVPVDTFLKNVQVIPKEPLKKADIQELAYVLYTSGSTGKPKGIAMPHYAICNHASWIINKFNLNENDRMLQLTSFSFDVAVCELYILLVGGTLVIPSKSVSKNIPSLLDMIQSQRITFLQFVPSLLNMLLTKEAFEKMATVRQALCGADILNKQDLKKWVCGCNIPLTNLYGLTETCIDSTYFDCKNVHNDHTIPIGNPLPNIEAYILDKNLSLLPREVLGDFYIGGACLARGYYRQRALTAKQFIPHPFKNGKRLFQTNDRVYMQKDSHIQYRGRRDSQIKMRGYRIELGEIETALAQYTKNIEKAVVKVIHPHSNAALCAYIVAEQPINVPQLKAFIQQTLPHYMVPSFYLQLKCFPLNSHGKIDLNQLPDPMFNHTSNLVGPQNQTESTIEKLWKEILQIDHTLSIDQNFFDLGGNSMHLMQVHDRLSTLFSKKISIEKLFEYPTIRTLGEFLSQTSKPHLDLASISSRIEKQHQKRKKPPSIQKEASDDFSKISSKKN